jgi:hypothetical protein
MKEMRTMVSPQSGFANRVMERVQTHKRIRARQRAVITAGLSVIALAGLIALAAFQLILQFEGLTTLPSSSVPLLVGMASFGEQALTLFDVVWLCVTTIVSSINILLLIAYVCVVTGMTVVWLRVAFGPFQYSLKLSWRI